MEALYRPKIAAEIRLPIVYDWRAVIEHAFYKRSTVSEEVLPSRRHPIWQNLGHFAHDDFRKLLQTSDLQDRPREKWRKFCHEKHFLFEVAKVQKTDGEMSNEQSPYEKCKLPATKKHWS